MSASEIPDLLAALQQSIARAKRDHPIHPHNCPPPKPDPEEMA